LNPNVQKLLDEVEGEAKSPIDQFRVIPVVGELAGRQEALARVEAFERAHKVVVLRRDVDLLRELYSRGRDTLGADDREYLIRRHGWFGQLAVSHGAPPDDPVRKTAIGAGRRVMIVLALMVFAGLGGLLVGIALLVLALVKLLGGTLRAAYVRPARWRAAPFVEAFALYLGGFLLLSLAMSLVLGEWGARSIWPSAAVVVILPLVVGWLRLRGLSKDEIRHGLGWHRGRGVVREALWGVVGYVAGLPVLALGFLVTAWLMKKTGAPAEHPIVHHALDRPLEALGVVVLACIVAPIVEETMFRGALFHHIRGRLGFVISAVITSLIFAAIHPQGWAAVPVLGAIAMVLAGIRAWRGSIIGPVVAHALNNGVVTILLLVGMS
jgi:membrane protease YdiL (CAAX protease family)